MNYTGTRDGLATFAATERDEGFTIPRGPGQVGPRAGFVGDYRPLTERLADLLAERENGDEHCGCPRCRRGRSVPD